MDLFHCISENMYLEENLVLNNNLQVPKYSSLIYNKLFGTYRSLDASPQNAVNCRLHIQFYSSFTPSYCHCSLKMNNIGIYEDTLNNT